MSGIGGPAQKHVEGAPSMAPEQFLKKQPMEVLHVKEGTPHQGHAMLTIAQVGIYYAHIKRKQKKLSISIHFCNQS